MTKELLNRNLPQRVLYNVGERRIGEAAKHMKPHEVRRQGGRQLIRRTAEAAFLTAGLTAAATVIGSHVNLREAADRQEEIKQDERDQQQNIANNPGLFVPGTGESTTQTTKIPDQQAPPETAQNNGE